MKTSDFLIKLIAGYDVRQKERQLFKDNARKKQELESALSKIKELVADIEALSLKLTHAEREIANHKSAIKDLYTEKEDLTSQNNSMREKVTEQAHEILFLRNLLNDAQQKNSDLLGHVQNVERNLSTQNDKLVKELENAIANLKSSESEENLLRQKIDKLETTIEEQQREIEKKRVNEQSLNATIKTLSEQLTLLEEEKEKYRVESEKKEERSENAEQGRDITSRDGESFRNQIANQEASMMVQNNKVEQKQTELGNLHAELDGTEERLTLNREELQKDENQFTNGEPYIEEEVCGKNMADNTPKEDSQQEETKNTMDNEIESMPVNDSTDIVFDEDTTVSKSLQDILKIADEATKDDCPYSSVELIPITDSEQTINNIVEEERAKDDTDKAKVATEESAELVTEEKSNSKLEEQKEEIEDVHTSVRRIEKIFDTETEKEIDAEEFFARPESELIKWREEFERCIKFSEKRFLCPFCRQQIKIAGRKFERGHISFFTHLHDSADCPIKTSVNMSKEEIEARKYGLCQESKRHKKLKQWIYDGLNGEQSKQQGVDNIKIEQRINANIPYFNWRRPDICATFKALNVVFELQLSTTFLSTIVDRDIFYRLHHYFIIWIFNFEENVKYVDLSNLMMKDIYYTNKRNIFVFDREAREVSEKRKELVLKCNWLTPENKWKYPVTKNGDGLDVSGKLITLSDLTFDETSGKVYYVDAEEEYYCAHPDARKIEKRIENDRKQLLERWMAHVKRNNDVPDEQEMMELVSQMVAKAERAVIYKVNNRMGLMYNFRHLTAPQYSSIEALGDYFLAKYNRKTALYDQYGRQILPCEYLNIYQRENGLIFAESTSTWSLLFDDKIEKLCDRNPHDKITIQNEGIRLRITIKHPYNGSETGYVLTDGINIIPFIYQSTKICKDGEHIIVCRNSLYGIYSKDLRLIIPIDYKSITPIENSQKCVAVNQDNAICLINLADATQQVLPYEQLRFNGGNFIVRQQGKEGVVDTNNTVIVPIAYQRCIAITNNYFKVKTIRDNAAENYGLYDCHGKQILQSQFNRINHIGDDLFILKKNDGKFALYNAACNRYMFGEEGFDDIKTYNNNTLFLLLKNYKYALANLDGVILTPFKYDYMDFSHKDYIKVKVGDSIGTLNYNGKEIYDNEVTLRDGYVTTSFFSKWNVMHYEKECLPRIYDAIELLTNDWVKVCQTNQWGICDLNGKCLLPIAYASITLYEEQGYIVVSQRKESNFLQKFYGILNMNLETVLPIAYTEPLKPLSKEYTLVGSSTFGVLAISSNQMIIPTSYSGIKLLTNNLFVVTKRGNSYKSNPLVKYGLYDKAGKRLLPCEYNHISNINENGEIMVELANRKGKIDGNGNKIYEKNAVGDGYVVYSFLGQYGIESDGTAITACKYESITYWGNHYFILTSNNLHGLFLSNEQILPINYQTIIKLTNNLLKIKDSSGCQLYDLTQRKVITPYYQDIQAPDENTGMLTVSTKVGKIGYINQQGEVQYTKKAIGEAYYIIEAFGEYGLVDTQNKQLCPCHYKQINHLYGHLFAVLPMKKKKWGLYLANESKVLTEFIYDEIWVDKNNSTLLAKRDNITGKLSEKGEEVHNILSLNLGENVSVIQCFDKVGIQNKETNEWLLPMKYQQFKKAGTFLLFREGHQWGLMDMEFHVLIEAKYKIMKIWNSDIFIVAETQYKSYGYDIYPKTRYGIISASGINLLTCNYVKIHIVNSNLVAAVRTMNEQALYFTVNNGTLQTVKREDLTQYINKCAFKVNEEYEGVIINKNPYSGIFVEVKGEGIGCIPKAALPKDYMQNRNMRKGMPIKIEVTNINELNQVKFKFVSVI